MNKGIMGTLFYLIAAILYHAKILSAAMVVNMAGTWGEKEFLQALSYTPDLLNLFIYLSFAIGTGLIVFQIMPYFSTKEDDK